jgi:3-hydroxymyristoyl/3-hydroxydecanoyl-(acyl carrier protein) dehydratase
MLAASNMRFRKSAFPGERIDYAVKLTREFEALWQFEVEATSRGQLIADGTVTNHMVEPAIPR